MRTDAELVAAYQAGDPDAFAAIYERYACLLTRYIYRRVRDWEWAEDIVQEAMLKAARYIPHGTMHDLNGYLTLCANQMRRRREQQARRNPGSEPFNPAARYKGYVGGVEELVLERELEREVVALLTSLPAEERAVSMLKVLAGYDLAAAADVLGISASAAKSAWRRCARRFTAWAGTKTGRAALDQALQVAAAPVAPPTEEQCQVQGCARPRHAHGRCQYHCDGMLTARRRYAAQRGGQ